MQGFAFLLNWSDKAYFCIAVTIYGIGMVYSLFLWRRGFRRDDWTAYSLLGSGFVFQTISIAIRAFKYDPPRCPEPAEITISKVRRRTQAALLINSDVDTTLRPRRCRQLQLF